MSHARTPKLLAAFVAIAGTLFPGTAFACWDGYRAQVGEVTLSGAEGYASWDPARARSATRWAARFDAIVPRGVTLDVSNQGMRCEGASACAKLEAIEVGSEDPKRAFDALADAFGISKRARAEALAVAQPVYTVQVFAGSKGSALALRDRLNGMAERGDLDPEVADGFFEQGGFPASNPIAHAVADKDDEKIVRVVVEEYATERDARAAAKRLAAQGFKTVVKALPQGKALDERVSTKIG